MASSNPWVVLSHAGRFDFAPVWFAPSFPFVPTCDPSDDESVTAAITALLRFDRTVARDYSPGLSPLVVVDEAIWNRIQRRFRWVPPERISNVQPATDEDLCAFAGTTKAALILATQRTMRGMRHIACDAKLRPIIPVFARAVELLHRRLEDAPASGKTIWADVGPQAAREWIEKTFPELVPILRGVPPTDRVYQDVFAVREKLAKNYRRAGCPKTKDYKSLITLLRHLERIGVFKMGRKRRYMWGRVWKNGLTAPVSKV